ncbi:hypothetical protein ED28_01050 [[Pantoea] beijingensis]|uniref:Lipoprotein n=1 Tax=[Pantoea] beijingensis TaxID=1324864 RepID=A0A443IHV2_9GAMM|nr:hypothetical protein [[Pantoea] beijingensis]RWR03603.1 hypothetical protein ED28_01050 [[Pantoea] beijingensis]
MMNRFTLAAVVAAMALTGCAKKSTDKPVADFTRGETLVTVTHVPARTSDGTRLFITVDGTDAGALATGESMALHVPAGSHQIGGYARSLIGRVTIAPVKVTTSPDSEKRVAYTMTKNRPVFTEESNNPATQQAAITPEG